MAHRAAAGLISAIRLARDGGGDEPHSPRPHPLRCYPIARTGWWRQSVQGHSRRNDTVHGVSGFFAAANNVIKNFKMSRCVAKMFLICSWRCGKVVSFGGKTMSLNLVRLAHCAGLARLVSFAAPAIFAALLLALAGMTGTASAQDRRQNEP